MKHNGNRQTDHRLEIAAVASARTVATPIRLALLTWLRQWKHRPGRVFWFLDPSTGQWTKL